MSSGRVWMFSHLIDDEDLVFLQREFISYKDACEYYQLGYKPIVRLAKVSGALYKVGSKALIRRSILEQYMRDHIRHINELYDEV